MPEILIKPDEWQRQPWRNNLGVTNIIWPRSPADDAGFQIHRTPITSSVAFSIYEDHERIFTLVGGNGLRLVINDENVDVTPFKPVRFPGEARVAAEIADGQPVEILNVIYARNRWKESVGAPAISGETMTIVHAAGNPVTLSGERGTMLLGDGQTLLSAASVPKPENPTGSLHIVLVALEQG